MRVEIDNNTEGINPRSFKKDNRKNGHRTKK